MSTTDYYIFKECLIVTKLISISRFWRDVSHSFDFSKLISCLQIQTASKSKLLASASDQYQHNKYNELYSVLYDFIQNTYGIMNHVPMVSKNFTSQLGSQFDFQFDFQNMKFPPNGEIPTGLKSSFFFVLFFLARATTPFQAIF